MKIKLQWKSIAKTAIITFLIILVVNKFLFVHKIHEDKVPLHYTDRGSGIGSAKYSQLKPPESSQKRGSKDTFSAKIQQPNVSLTGNRASPVGGISAFVPPATHSPVPAPMPKLVERVNHVPHSYSAETTKTGTDQVKLRHKSVDRINSYSGNMPAYLGISWEDFLKLPRLDNSVVSRDNMTTISPLNRKFQPVVFCSSAVERSLTLPRLTANQQKWCRWALSSEGGRVVVGKSWGNLKTKQEKEDFDDFNCNAYSRGVNPSCNDAWGDEAVANWMKSTVSAIQCKPGSSSSVQCRDNENQDRQCTFRNVQINFGYMEDRPRPPPALTPTKTFKKGFFSVDCPMDTSDSFLKFEHLYSSKLQSRKCDYVMNGTVLLYSHDDIRNLGHTMNDIMNVFLLRWLHRIARHSDRVTFLNVDSFNLGHNHHDTISNPFYTTYNKTFDVMVRGRDFGARTLCLQNVIMQSSPPKFFVWDSWFRDHDCTFRGPSTLFQRYNLETRHNYGLLMDDPDMFETNKAIRVLMLVRKQTKNLWGDSQTSRNHLNQPEVDKVMNETLLKAYPDLIYEPVSFEHIPFEQQMRMIASSTILIGMHGAGITQGLHMPIGTKYCCGVIEIFPSGYYFPIRGHANMMRKTGLKYARVEISSSDSTSTGATIPAMALAEATLKMVDEIVKAPTCILRKAYEDPYMEAI